MKLWLTYLKAALAMAFWSLTFVWFKVAFRTYRPYEITLLRLILASVLLFGIMWLGRKGQKIRRKDFLQLMLVAFCEPFLYFVGEANGMQFVSSTLGSLVISTIPLVTAFGAWMFLRERITPWLFVGLIVSFAGVAVMSMDSADLSGTFKGIAFLMLAVFAGMFYGLLVKRLTHSYSALTIVAWQSLFGMLYFLPLLLIFDLKHFMSIQHQFLPLVAVIAMSLFASVGAFLLYTGVIRELGVIRSNVFTNLIPVFTVALAFVLLGDRLGLRSGFGLGLTLFGLFISQYPDLRQLHRRVMQPKDA